MALYSSTTIYLHVFSKLMAENSCYICCKCAYGGEVAGWIEKARGKGREGKGREGKGREGKGRGKGREGKGREGKGREGKGREGKGREGKGREGKGREGKGREGKGREEQKRLHLSASSLTRSQALYRAAQGRQKIAGLSCRMGSTFVDQFLFCILMHA